MSYLLDTHYVLWSLIEPDHLDRRARAAMRNSSDASG